MADDIIPSGHVKDTCKFGKEGCCSYLSLSGAGFACFKADPSMRAAIDRRRETKSMNAMGDNCAGWGVQGLVVLPKRAIEA